MKMMKRLYPFKDLLAIFIWREFTIRYRHSILGVAWALVQPVSMMLLFLFVFTYTLDLHLSEYQPALFFYAGLLPWIFFSSSVNFSIPSLTNHYGLITKIYFPREIIPLSGIALALLDAVIGAVVLVALLVVYGVSPTWSMLWVLPLWALLVLFTVSVSMFLAGLNVYYRDVRLASGFLIQFLFFASPIVYSLDRVDPSVKQILLLNPLTFLIESIRECLVGGRGITLLSFVMVCAVVGSCYLLAYRFFITAERAFADVI
jgi:ABC-type polysaccharide/polyol phosphate export permease